MMDSVLSEMTFGILLTVISIASLVLNLLLIFFVCVVDKRLLRKPINIHILSISVSDLILSAIVTPMFAIVSLMKWTPYPSQNNAVIENLKSCRIGILNIALAEIACLNSIYTMVALAAERYRALVNPFKRAPFSIRHSMYAIIGIWLTSIFYGLTITFFMFQRFYKQTPLVANEMEVPLFPSSLVENSIKNLVHDTNNDLLSMPYRLLNIKSVYETGLGNDHITSTFKNSDLLSTSTAPDTYQHNEINDSLQAIGQHILTPIDQQKLSFNVPDSGGQFMFTSIVDSYAARKPFVSSGIFPIKSRRSSANNGGDLSAKSSTFNSHLNSITSTRTLRCQFRISELRSIYVIDIVMGYILPLLVVAVLYGKILATLTTDNTHRRPESLDRVPNPNQPIKIRISGGEGSRSRGLKKRDLSLKRRKKKSEDLLAAKKNPVDTFAAKMIAQKPRRFSIPLDFMEATKRKQLKAFIQSAKSQSQTSAIKKKKIQGGDKVDGGQFKECAQLEEGDFERIPLYKCGNGVVMDTLRQNLLYNMHPIYPRDVQVMTTNFMTRKNLPTSITATHKATAAVGKDSVVNVNYDRAKYKLHPIDHHFRNRFASRTIGPTSILTHSKIYELISTRAHSLSIFRQGTTIQKRRAVLMILGIVVLFALSWLPLHIVKLMEEFAPVTHFVHSRKYRWLRKLCILFAMTSTWANVLVYFYFNAKYKQNFINYVRRLSFGQRLRDVLSTNHCRNIERRPNLFTLGCCSSGRKKVIVNATPDAHILPNYHKYLAPDIKKVSAREFWQLKTKNTPTRHNVINGYPGI